MGQRTYATLDDDEQVPLDQLGNAPGGGAPSTVNYLVGTADAGLSNEIVVGATPGGELGNTWASPTVDATHSGSTHAATQAAAEGTAAGALASHEADTTAIHGIADTALLATDAEVATAVSDHAAAADPHAVYLKEADFDDVDFLVGTATGHTGAEIVVGTSPGGELGGTWASPTVDATHSGSTHGAAVTTHEAAGDPHTGYVLESDHTSAAHDTLGLTTDALLATAVSDHAGLADPHTGYRLESADHSHATTGLQGGTVAHTALTSVGANDHHAQLHATAHQPGGGDAMAVDAAAATGSLRTLGTGATQAATGTHTHAGASIPYEPGTFTLTTGNGAVQVDLLQLTTTQVATLEGTAVLLIH